MVAAKNSSISNTRIEGANREAIADAAENKPSTKNAGISDETGAYADRASRTAAKRPRDELPKISAEKLF